MPKFVIEREIPGVGKLTSAELKTTSIASCGALNQLGPQIQWVQSHVTANKVFCVYISPNKGMIEEHARISGIPATAIHEVMAVIDPTTAE